MIELGNDDPRPLFRQIVDGIRRKVAAGELSEGSRLPSVRALAMMLMINPNTVAKAYAELTAEGLIESHKGVGLFIAAPRQRLNDEERRRRLDQAVEQLVAAVLPLGFPLAQVLDTIAAELAPLITHDPDEG